MYAFGGAGPVHGYRVAEILGSPEVIVPYGAGVGSTIGFLVAPVAFDFVRSYVCRLAHADWDIVNKRLSEMETEGRAILEGAGIPPSRITYERSAELRYVGQGHDVRVSLPDGTLDESRRAEMEQRFAQEYARLYGRTPTGNPVEAMTWRLIARADEDEIGNAFSAGPGAQPGAVTQTTRAIYLPEDHAMVPVPVYSRYTLPADFECDGPCVIEERESTTIIGRNARVRVDDHRSIVISLGAKS